MISGLKDRIMNTSSSAKKIVLISSAAVLTLVIAICGICICAKQITIIDEDGNAKELVTFKRCVSDVLEAQNIALGTRDKLSVPIDAKLKDGLKIEIYRAFNVTITEKGVSRNLIATQPTAGRVLQELGYNPRETDKITPGFNERVSDFDEITIVRVRTESVTATEEIPYESQERENKSLASGTRKLVQKGVPGEKSVQYKITYEDDVEVSRTVISEKVTTEPIPQIREIGKKKAANYVIASAGTVQTSRSGNLAYSKVISANATAYDASSCGKSPSHPAYGVTATGMKAGYGVVAVDPSVIPLGSRLYIESADGSYIYGSAIAADTGGAIKGNRIDLCFNTRSEAISFGRRAVKVYVLK